MVVALAPTDILAKKLYDVFKNMILGTKIQALLVSNYPSGSKMELTMAEVTNSKLKGAHFLCTTPLKFKKILEKHHKSLPTISGFLLH